MRPCHRRTITNGLLVALLGMTVEIALAEPSSSSPPDASDGIGAVHETSNGPPQASPPTSASSPPAPRNGEECLALYNQAIDGVSNCGSLWR